MRYVRNFANLRSSRLLAQCRVQTILRQSYSLLSERQPNWAVGLGRTINGLVASQFRIALFSLLEDSSDAPDSCWISAEYLYWWISRGSTPPLVTTGSPADPFPGAIGQPGTQVLFGGRRELDFNGMSGMRFGAGTWLGPRSLWGVEASGFSFDHAVDRFRAASDTAGNPPLFIPFFRPDVGREGGFTVSTPAILNPIARPGFFAGAVNVDAITHLWGTEANILRNITRTNNVRLDWLLGFRFLDLSEGLAVSGTRGVTRPWAFNRVSLTDLRHAMSSTPDSWAAA